MRRAYKTVEVMPSEAVAGGQGFCIALDGRPVRTPAKQALSLSTRGLADAIAAEWSGQGERVDPLSMPLTQLANTALDRVPITREAAVADILGYGDTDLVCYRVTGPQELVARQTERWDPILDWAGRRLGCRPATTTGLSALEQPRAFHDALRAAVAPLDDFRLAGMHLATGVSGSVLLGLALVEGALDAEAAFDAAMVDDLYQLDRWGEDKEARERLDRVRLDLEAAARFVRLHGGH